MTLSEIAKAVGGELNGNDNPEIKRCADMESAGQGDISYIENKKFLHLLKKSSPSAVIVARGMEVDIPSIETDNPLLAFAKTIELLHPKPEPEPGIHLTAVIDPSAKIGEGSSVGPLSTVGAGAEIGKNTAIHPSVTISDNCRIGDNCVIYPKVAIINASVIGNRVIVHSGSVIGSDGFKYVQDDKGRSIKVRHIGRVRIGHDVEIGANCAIDRAFLGETVLEGGVKLDNLVHIAHNVRIGADSLIAGQVGIAGSTKVGKKVVMGGQVGLADHIEVPDNSLFAGKSGVTSSLEKPGVYAGIPAVPISTWRRIVTALLQLPELIKRVRKLEKGKKGDRK